MSISISCPYCRRPYRLKDKFAGKRVKCRECTKEFLVPSTMPPAVERSEAGDAIYRYQPRTTEPELVFEPTPFLSEIERHIEKTIGPVSNVFHELVSSDIHLDLHIVPPTGSEPTEAHPLGGKHWTIVTSGMSSRPMTLPAQAATWKRYAELMISLPADWPGLLDNGQWDGEAMRDDAHWWPMRWLKNLARMPHAFNTFLAAGHTVPSDDPPEPYSPQTDQCCMFVWPSLLAPTSSQLIINDDIVINFYALWPIYLEEMNLKLQRGTDALLEKLDQAELFDLLDLNRPNTCWR